MSKFTYSCNLTLPKSELTKFLTEKLFVIIFKREESSLVGREFDRGRAFFLQHPLLH